jgi:hypothetical protein
VSESCITKGGGASAAPHGQTATAGHVDTGTFANCFLGWFINEAQARLAVLRRSAMFRGALVAAAVVSSPSVAHSSNRALQEDDVTATGVCADLDSNSVVDVNDLLIMLGAFGASTAGDINGDVATDVNDLLLLLGQFGSTCSSEAFRVCAPIWSGEDHACRGDHSYAGALYDGSVDSHVECQALCQADLACTGGSFFSGDTGTEQWNGAMQVAFSDGCYLFGAAGSWPGFDVCPEHWSIYSNPAVQSFECTHVNDAEVVYPYMQTLPQPPSCGEGYYVNAEWAREPPDWFHRSIVSGIIHREFGTNVIEYPVPFAWPCWLCQPGSYAGAGGCTSDNWFHGNMNFNEGWGRPTPTASEPCCVLCPVNTYDDDADSRTPCVACPAGKHTEMVGSVQCVNDACPTGQCGVAPLFTASPNSGVQCAASTATNCVRATVHRPAPHAHAH